MRHARRAVVGHRLAAVRVEFRVGAAAQFRRRVPDAAGVDAHQVEVLRDLGVGEARAHAGDGIDRRGAGPAGVDHEYADLLARRRHSDNGQLRLCAFGFRIVEGHGDSAALRGWNRSGVAEEALAATPYRRLSVDLSGLPVGRRIDARARAGGRHQQRKYQPPHPPHGRHRCTRRGLDSWLAYPWNTTVTWL